MASTTKNKFKLGDKVKHKLGDRVMIVVGINNNMVLCQWLVKQWVMGELIDEIAHEEEYISHALELVMPPVPAIAPTAPNASSSGDFDDDIPF